MNRRLFIAAVAGAACARALPGARAAGPDPERIEPVVRTDAQWRAILTPEQYHVLRQEGTERPFSSPLNNEKRKGTFVCAGCELALFVSATKYDSGTGWPSFYDCIKGHVATQPEIRATYFTYSEYHCARCGGHHGHVFNDGPKPTGLRYCENGVAVKFVPA
jgi:peptide-methionine (R)-S-oxide reductase